VGKGRWRSLIQRKGSFRGRPPVAQMAWATGSSGGGLGDHHCCGARGARRRRLTESVEGQLMLATESLQAVSGGAVR
jgi:hypothetical protein